MSAMFALARSRRALPSRVELPLGPLSPLFDIATAPPPTPAG